MKKKIVIPIITFFVLLLVAGGFFWWQRKQESEVGLLNLDGATEEIIGNKKIIKEKKSGLEMKIPKNWGILRGGDMLGFFSPDFKLHPSVGPYMSPIPEKGCVVEVSVKKEIEGGSYDIEYSVWKEEMKKCLDSPEDCSCGENCRYEIVKIDKLTGLKQIYFKEQEDQLPQGEAISVKVLKGNGYIYFFETYLFSPEKESCRQQFNEILNSISIK